MKNNKKNTRLETLQSMIKVFLIFSIAIFMIGNVLALDSLGIFKQYEQVRITQVCNGATSINISSIMYPNSSVIESNIVMNSAGNGEYYFDFLNTTELGKYDVRGIANGCENTFATYFEITPTGREEKSFLNNTTLIVLGILSILFMIISIIMKMPMIGFIGSILILLLGTYTMLYGFNDITNLYTTGASICIIGLGFIFLFISSYEWINWGGSLDE